MINSAVKAFSDAISPGVKFVERSNAGALVSWVENGFNLAVTRSTDSRTVVLTAKAQGKSATEVLNFGPTGLYVGSIGDTIPTVFAQELRFCGVSGVGMLSADESTKARHLVSGYVNAPAVLNGSNAADYNGATVSLAAGSTMTVDDSAWPMIQAGLVIQVGQSGSASLAFSGAAAKESASGTASTTVTLSACGIYSLTQSPGGSPKFRLAGGAAL